MPVRPTRPEDADARLTLRDALWPGYADDHAIEIEVFFQDSEAVRIVCYRKDFVSSPPAPEPDA